MSPQIVFAPGTEDAVTVVFVQPMLVILNLILYHFKSTCFFYEFYQNVLFGITRLFPDVKKLN